MEVVQDEGWREDAVGQSDRAKNKAGAVIPSILSDQLLVTYILGFMQISMNNSTQPNISSHPP